MSNMPAIQTYMDKNRQEPGPCGVSRRKKDQERTGVFPEVLRRDRERGEEADGAGTPGDQADCEPQQHRQAGDRQHGEQLQTPTRRVRLW